MLTIETKIEVFLDKLFAKTFSNSIDGSKTKEKFCKTDDFIFNSKIKSLFYYYLYLKKLVESKSQIEVKLFKNLLKVPFKQ